MKLLGYRIQSVVCGTGLFIHTQQAFSGGLNYVSAFNSAFNEVAGGHTPCTDCWVACSNWDELGRFMFTDLVTLRTLCNSMLQWIEDNPGIYEVVSVWGEGIDMHDVYYSTDGVQGVFHVERVTLQVEDVTLLNEEPKLRKDVVCI